MARVKEVAQQIGDNELRISETRRRIRLEDALTNLQNDVLFPLAGLATICQFTNDEVPNTIRLGDEVASITECIGRLLGLLCDKADSILTELDSEVE